MSEDKKKSKPEPVDAMEWAKKHPQHESFLSFMAACVTFSRTEHPDRDALIIDCAKHLEGLHRAASYITCFDALRLAFSQMTFDSKIDRECVERLIGFLTLDSISIHNSMTDHYSTLLTELQTAIPESRMAFEIAVPNPPPAPTAASSKEKH